MTKILNKNYIQSTEKDIALILLPAVVCYTRDDIVNEIPSLIELFSSSNINTNLIIDELDLFMESSLLQHPYTSIKETPYFNGIFYKNDKPENKALKRLSLGIHYLNFAESGLVSSTHIFKFISPMLQVSNSNFKTPITSSSDLSCYAAGSNPKTVEGVLKRIDFQEKYCKEIFKLNSNNIMENNKLSNLSNASVNNFIDLNDKNKSSNTDIRDFVDLREMLKYSLYGVVCLDAKSNKDASFIDKFTHMFKHKLIETCEHSEFSLTDITNTPLIEFISDLKKMGVHEDYLQLQFNHSDNCKNVINYEDMSSSHHLDFFSKISNGLAYEAKNKGLNAKDCFTNVLKQLNRFTDFLIRFEIPLLDHNEISHRNEIKIIAMKTIESIYKVKAVPKSKNEIK